MFSHAYNGLPWAFLDFSALVRHLGDITSIEIFLAMSVVKKVNVSFIKHITHKRYCAGEMLAVTSMRQGQ